MTATGLDPASVTAVLCVDAAQFPPDFGATFVEAHRVLAPGGPAVFTGWEARDPQDPVVPERIGRVDLAAGLTAAGFVDVRSRSREDWLADERDAWRAVVALPPTDDPALQSLQAEGRRVSSAGTRSAGCWRPVGAPPERRRGIRGRMPGRAPESAIAAADVAHVSSVRRPDGERGLTGTRTSTYRRTMQRLEVLILIPSRGEVR